MLKPKMKFKKEQFSSISP